MSISKRWVLYTLEGSHVAAVTIKMFGIPMQTLENWVHLGLQGSAQGSQRQVGEPGVNEAS